MNKTRYVFLVMFADKPKSWTNIRWIRDAFESRIDALKWVQKFNKARASANKSQVKFKIKPIVLYASSWNRYREQHRGSAV